MRLALLTLTLLGYPENIRIVYRDLSNYCSVPVFCLAAINEEKTPLVASGPISYLSASTEEISESLNEFLKNSALPCPLQCMDSSAKWSLSRQLACRTAKRRSMGFPIEGFRPGVFIGTKPGAEDCALIHLTLQNADQSVMRNSKQGLHSNGVQKAFC